MIPRCATCSRDASQVPMFWVRDGDFDVCHFCLLTAKYGAPDLPSCTSCGKRATLASAGRNGDYYCAEPECRLAYQRAYAIRKRQAYLYGE